MPIPHPHFLSGWSRQEGTSLAMFSLQGLVQDSKSSVSLSDFVVSIWEGGTCEGRGCFFWKSLRWVKTKLRSEWSADCLAYFLNMKHRAVKLNKAIVTNRQSWIDSMFRTRTKCSSNGNQWGLGCLRITLTLWAILPPVSPFLGPQIGTPTRNQNTVGLPLEVQMTGKQTQVLPVWLWGSSK